jgi:serine/threonine protein kinase
LIFFIQHARNVLIHKGDIKVADFGLSMNATEASNYSVVLGLVPYIDPKLLNNIKYGYTINFKSDIYSIGVLFWLLSSGRRPFCDEGAQYDTSLAVEIVNGKREKIIENTPVEYSNLYTGNKFYASWWDGMIYIFI